ncbi:MAG: hypothetical protein AAGJ82_11580, partial [Bacteroidota bacterium]
MKNHSQGLNSALSTLRSALLLVLVAGAQWLMAQDCDLACVNTPEVPLNVTIPPNCVVTITTDMVVPDLASCPGAKRLTVR